MVLLFGSCRRKQAPHLCFSNSSSATPLVAETSISSVSTRAQAWPKSRRTSLASVTFGVRHQQMTLLY